MTTAGQHRILKPRIKKTVVKSTMTERILKEIKSSLHQEKYFPAELVPYLLKWAKIQIKGGLSMDDIADALNDMELPTTSGCDVWRGDTIKYLFDYFS